jgi:hypothetical protein
MFRIWHVRDYVLDRGLWACMEIGVCEAASSLARARWAADDLGCMTACACGLAVARCSTRKCVVWWWCMPGRSVRPLGRPWRHCHVRNATVTHSLAVRMSAAWQDPTTASHRSQAVTRSGSTPHRAARFRLRTWQSAVSARVSHPHAKMRRCEERDRPHKIMRHAMYANE